MARNALPLSAGHFHPRVCPAHINVESLSRFRALTFEGAGRDGGVAKDRYLHVRILGALILSRLSSCERLSLVVNLTIELRTYELFGQQRDQLLDIICFL